MLWRPKIKHSHFLTLNGIFYSFDMAVHLNKQLNQEVILTKICETISEIYEAEFPAWSTLPIEGYGVTFITQTDDLYQYLDAESGQNAYNFLIFERTNEKSITISHFGPIGRQTEAGTFSEQFDRTEKQLEILKEILEKVRPPENTISADKEEVMEIVAKVKESYWEILETIEKDIEVKKKELFDLSNDVCGDADSRENARKLIGRINVSASTGKIVLKSVTAVLFAELIEEMAKKFGIRTATQTAAKVGPKIGAASGSKWMSKAMPLVGLVVGAGFGVWRVAQGDLSGAGMEIASGAAACVPGSGTATSLAIDALLMAKDISEATGPKNENFEKLSLQVKNAESDLIDLSDRYEKALADYEFVEEILDHPRLSVQNLDHEIQSLSEILAAVRLRPIMTLQGLPVIVAAESTGPSEFDNSVDDTCYVIV